MMFPVQARPAGLQPTSAAIPLTHGLTIVRDGILLDRGFIDLAPVFIRLLISGAIFMTIGFVAFRYMERKARERGVLGRY